MKKILLSAAVIVIAGTLFSADRFTDNADGTIKDNATGLVWTKCTFKTVSPAVMDATADCSDTHTGGTWENALLACEGLSHAGRTDWRLPNCSELGSIVSYYRINPSINTVYFPGTEVSYYRTSSTFVGDAGQAWYYDFSNGTIYYMNKTSPLHVRCVRSGP